MKIGSIPIAAITLLFVALTKYIVKNLFAASFSTIAPYLDGALMGILLVYLIYYANIYITAWIRNRKEELTD
ncbi:MAG TPA: hypothetical protein VGI43_08405 [Mucilaginibacter sp.]|jgi:hypothetical protein